jgi:hypothetical protein
VSDAATQKHGCGSDLPFDRHFAPHRWRICSSERAKQTGRINPIELAARFILMPRLQTIGDGAEYS